MQEETTGAEHWHLKGSKVQTEEEKDGGKPRDMCDDAGSAHVGTSPMGFTEEMY